MARDLVRRNVVELAEIPTGRPGRQSKSLIPEQVDGVLIRTAPDRLHNYIVVSLPGIDPSMWTPRELRHSFVSVLSDGGCRWRRSRSWSATVERRSRNWSTGTSSSL
jgi:hypothetical protein